MRASARVCGRASVFSLPLSLPLRCHQPILAQNVIRWIKRGHYFIMSNNHVHSNRIFDNNQWQNDAIARTQWLNIRILQYAWVCCENLCAVFFLLLPGECLPDTQWQILRYILRVIFRWDQQRFSLDICAYVCVFGQLISSMAFHHDSPFWCDNVI